MKALFFILIPVVFLFLPSCKDENHDSKTSSAAAMETIFPKGEKITNNNFKGAVWLNTLVPDDSLSKTGVGNVTFEPGARTNWHLHPGGQILLATGGVGYYQEKGSAVKILRKGDVVKCAANIAHWHGASKDTAFIQIAITDRQNGPTQWLQPVTDEEYNAK